MASEAISSSIMIIGAVLGAAVLITAILPAIFSAGDTFGTVSSSAEQKLKTDFRIINTYAYNTPDTVKVWLKNVGANRISISEIQNSDVFFGVDNQVSMRTYSSGFTYDLMGATDDGYWDIGETLEITIVSPTIDSGDQISFSFALPNSVRRTIAFSTNN
ncbi:hypothetical protein ACKUB1_10590 [Methanospirillum stamsii]|uniref:Flagellin n=1 Tax=Methanospirillum stamsii TaxID=1277351 RepID=A0A2V2N6U5_9EURY|nr:hypothetical protein [Methanospirillum stamsii]PWR75792.1 hypothetical protein DLD82_02860 [Methanospirillum stamsii]